jgi:aryl-alcohol dehydrogenase-like predicted oxidoreductase
MTPHEGPTIDELLADPLIRAVMRADHVELLALRSQMVAAGPRIATGKARSPSPVGEVSKCKASRGASADANDGHPARQISDSHERESAMKYATLGNTGLLVSKLCFGTMTFGDGRGLFKGISSVGQAGADELVKTAIDGGINFFDTADNYTEGESERILGQSLKNLNIARKDVVIATKVYSRVGPGRNDIGASRGHIMDAVEASLLRLQSDHIDLYQIHGNDAVTPVEETLRALDTLAQQGKVRYVGCSNWQAWKLAKALCISEFKNLARLDTLQAYYSIAGRDLEREIVPLLETEKVGLLVWSPLAGGLLSGKFSRTNQKPADSRRTEYDFPIVDKERTWNILDVMAPIAKAHGCSPARVSLAWLLAKPVVTSVIIGANRLDQLQDNLAAVELTLTPDELKQLDEISVLPPEYPGWVLPFQGADRLEVADRWQRFRETEKRH